jgi:hypothetical protein
MYELFLGFFLLVIALCLFEYRIQKRLDGLFRTLDKLEIEVVKLSGNEERVRWLEELSRPPRRTWGDVISAVIGWTIFIVVMGVIWLLAIAK